MTNDERLMVSKQLAKDALSLFADAGYADYNSRSEAMAESKAADLIYAQIAIAENSVRSDLLDALTKAVANGGL